MSEHHDVKKAHEPHPIHEEHAKGPHDPRGSIQRWLPISPTGLKSLASQAINSTKPFAVTERM